MRKINYYLATERLEYGLIVPIIYSKLRIPRNTKIFEKIKNYKYDFVSIKISKSNLEKIGNNEFKLLNNLSLKKKQVERVYVYDKNIERHREYTIDDYYNMEINRIKRNVEDNMSSNEREFYESIKSGARKEIVIYRTMCKKEYDKLIAGKSINGKFQAKQTSGAYGKKLVCFFDDNMSDFAEISPNLSSYKILSFKAKVSDLILSFGRYDDEDENGIILERWHYEWTIKKYNLKIFKLLRVKDFDRQQSARFLKLYMKGCRR